MLKEGNRFAAEQPLQEVFDDLADDLCGADAGKIDFRPAFAARAQIAFGLEASEVGLNGLKVELPIGGEGREHPPPPGPPPPPHHPGPLPLTHFRRPGVWPTPV